MTVQEVIDKLKEDTYTNELGYTLDVEDEEGNRYQITGYDWCNAILRIVKEE